MQRSPIDSETLGLIYGFFSVLGFSLTLPATRVAVADLDPIIVGLGRALYQFSGKSSLIK